MTTHHVSKQHIHTDFDKSIEPVVAIDPGQHVVLETLDACWNEVRSLADFEIHRHGGKPGTGNPITGPCGYAGPNQDRHWWWKSSTLISTRWGSS